METESLLVLHRAPISSLGFAVTVLSDRIAQIDSNRFLLLTKHGADLAVLPEPEMYSLVWAASAGALRRVIEMEIESDEGTIERPPQTFLLGNSLTYGEIQTECKMHWPTSTIETASYRIATDGKFICRNIETPAASFHFRSPTHDDNEPPFVIKHKLAKG